jgi:hypothetical protein
VDNSPLIFLDNLRRCALSYATLMKPWASRVALKMEIDGEEFPIPIPPLGMLAPATSEPQAFTPSPVQRRILTALASGPKTATQLRAMPRIGPHLYDKPRGGMHELREVGAVDRADGKFLLTEWGEELAEEFEEE